MIARRTARLGKPAHSVKTIRAGVFMALSMLLPPGKKWKTGWRRMAPRVVGQSAVDQAVSCFGHGLTLQHNAVELMQSALARTRSRIRTIGIGELREPAGQVRQPSRARTVKDKTRRSLRFGMPFVGAIQVKLLCRTHGLGQKHKQAWKINESMIDLQKTQEGPGSAAPRLGTCALN